MSINSKWLGAVRLATGIGVGTLALAFAPGAMAQDDGADAIEEIVTTGSRIKRIAEDGPSPVTNISREDMEAIGLLSVGDILQRLPVQGSGLNTTYNNGGSGSTRVDIRNLGSSRTLVLVNGRRWVNSGTGANSSVDLNTIPMSAIERVEVLKDGASAVYGSDAIAGVINIILRDNVEGLSFSAHTGDYFESGGGQSTEVSILAGVGNDNGNITFGASWTEVDAVGNADRAETAARPANGGSSGTPQGRFGYGGVMAEVDNWTVIDGAAGTDMSDFREWTDDDRFNYNPYNYITTPSERRSVFLNGHYTVAPSVAATFDALYQNRLSDQLLAPTPLFWGFMPNEGIHVDNPYNPTGMTLCGFYDDNVDGTPCDAVGWFGRRMLEAGNRNFMQNVQTFRASFGLEGDIGTWSWDVHASWNQNENVSKSYGLLNTESIARALGDPALCTGDCVPLNVFGGQGTDAAYLGDGLWSGSGSITQEMLDYISFVAHNTGGNTMNNITANLTGNLFNLPAGLVQAAIGFERRDESGYSQPDALIVTGATSGNAAKPTSGGFKVDEVYAELSIPLLSGAAIADSLTLNLAARRSDYSTFGSTTNPKINLTWRLNDSLLVRLTQSDGFRAPSIAALYSGQGDSYPTLADPCDVNSDNFTGSGTTQTNAQCIADGVPDGFTQPNDQIRITVGGNPDLQPEESTSLSAGIVFTPTFLDGLLVTFDYFDIEIDGAMAGIGSQNILDQCYSDSPQYCDMIDRGPGGYVNDLRDLSANVAGFEISGYDVVASYEMDTRIGQFNVGVDWTHYSDWIFVNALGTRYNYNGYVFGGDRSNFVKNRAIYHLDYAYGDLSVRWTADWKDSASGVYSAGPSVTVDGEFDIGDEVRKLSSTMYHDLAVSYAFDKLKTRVTVGVQNVLDEDPPFFPETFANDFDPNYRMWSSRSWYAKLTTTF